MVLDILAHHPSTAKFIATKLVRHFVSDTPPQGLADRVAATFTKSGGDIRETLKAIFFSKKFPIPTEAYRVKVKRPFELVISAIRTLGTLILTAARERTSGSRHGRAVRFQTPNGYSDAAESWVNTGDCSSE